jgi:mRNA interferase MazF
MLTSGDVVAVDLCLPEGREAGFRHPAVLITAQGVLDQGPSVVHVVPLTSTIRDFGSEVVIDPHHSGLAQDSAAQCQHLRAVSVRRLGDTRGNVGPVDLRRVREVVAVLLDIA